MSETMEQGNGEQAEHNGQEAQGKFALAGEGQPQVEQAKIGRRVNIHRRQGGNLGNGL